MTTNSTAAEVVIAGIGHPATDESTVASQLCSTFGVLEIENLPSNVGACVDKSNEPTVANLVRRAFGLAFADTEFLELVNQMSHREL